MVDRLIDAVRAHDIEHSEAESDAGESTLALRFLGGDLTEIILTGPEADAAWEAVGIYLERQGAKADLDTFMNRKGLGLRKADRLLRREKGRLAFG